MNCTIQELSRLNENLVIMENRCDTLEMYAKRSNIRKHGIAIQKDENTTQVIYFASTKFKHNFFSIFNENCYGANKK